MSLLFCDVDDFRQAFWQAQPKQLVSKTKAEAKSVKRKRNDDDYDPLSSIGLSGF